jgi:hypothetical protein
VHIGEFMKYSFPLANILLLTAAVTSVIGDESTDFFEKRVRPILVERCYDCHGEETAEGKLRLDSKSGWARGGESGPAIVPGDPAASLLLRETVELQGGGGGALVHTFASDSHPEATGPILELLVSGSSGSGCRCGHAALRDNGYRNSSLD